MKKGNRAVACFLALTMCGSMAACGNSSVSATASAKTPAAAQAASSGASATTAAGAAAQASGDTINIGGIYNVTGDQSTLDAPSQQGFELAVDEINAAGGINGHKLKATFYDGKTDQTTCANDAKKLIDTDKVVAIGGLSDSDYAYASGAIAQTAGIPIVFSGATTPDIPSTVGNCAFLTAFGDNVCAYAAADFYYNKLKAKKVYVLTDKAMSYTVNLSNYFMERFKSLGGEIVLQDYFSTGDQDFSAQISRYLAGGEADAMFMATGPGDASTVIQQYRSGGVKAPMISGDGWDTDLWSVAKDLANQDIYCCTHYSSEDTSEVVQNFIASYKKKYNKDPENAFAPLGYDCVMVMKKAIEMCGNDITSAKIRDNLENISNLQCVTGSISYTKDNHVPAKSVVVTKAKDGKLSFVENVKPDN